MMRSIAAAIVFLAAVAAAGAAERIHGADSHYESPAVGLAWAVLRDADETKTSVVVRIVDRAHRGWHLLAEGVDPFSGARRALFGPVPVGSGVDLVVPRATLADLPSIEIHFGPTADALAAGERPLTIYYLGVPDTTPEFPTRAAMEAYLTRTLARP
ncbi:MAG: hypothetical protein AB7P02_02245 [Alphaproteobacteria bacterium]